GDPKNWLIVRKREQSAPAARNSGRRYEPMLATLAAGLPQGSGWTFEPKWDGYRALAYVREGEVELRSRRDNDLTERFAEIARAVEGGEGRLGAARGQGLEGVMAKRLSCPYEQKRSRNWLKVKVRPEQEFVVAGYTKGQGRRAKLGSLVLAVRERGKLRWVGNVGTGFTEKTLADLLERLRALERPDSRFPEPPTMPRARQGAVVG